MAGVEGAVGSAGYTCAQCHQWFACDPDWTDEDSMAEAEDVFGDALGDDPVVVCDDCYQAMNQAVPMREWARKWAGG